MQLELKGELPTPRSSFFFFYFSIFDPKIHLANFLSVETLPSCSGRDPKRATPKNWGVNKSAAAKFTLPCSSPAHHPNGGPRHLHHPDGEQRRLEAAVVSHRVGHRIAFCLARRHARTKNSDTLSVLASGSSPRVDFGPTGSTKRTVR